MTTTTPESTAFDHGVRPVLELLLRDRAQRVLTFRPDAKIQARIDELAGKASEGDLNDEERAEYEGYVRANKFIAILRRQARRFATAESAVGDD